MESHEAIARTAERQHGLITTHQAVEAGLSERQIQHRVTSGRWERVRPRVYLVRGAPRSWPQAVLSAVLAAGEPAWASHRTAARLWGLPVDTDDAIDITTPLERRVRLPGVRGHRSGVWDERDVTKVGVIPTTTVARTLADLSTQLGVDGLGRALDEALRRRTTSLSAMHAVALRFGIAPGRSPKTMHEVLRLRIPGYDPGDSDLETWVWMTIQEAGLPLPVRQHPVVVKGRRYRIDMAYVDERIAIEVDSFAWHGTRRAFDADRLRGNLISLAGWTRLHYTSRSTTEDIVDDITTALFGHETTRSVGE